ncbi:E3 ubiquitin-protein ligase UPL7 [Dendrobium catenatum]|uniref:HECT-type E3 ubiquitin transferase n=1 Tax=Dendrobium catenatum TaxID=906689 RepID=A0A2I0WRS3_9ASPA|nr:E3 ubiquitin-protein ligase UPL7 [Dendrobium catenatum]
MSASRKQSQVSLRGASAREISRDALLEKVAHEREHRSFTRRASAAALFIQRIWRRYYEIKKVGGHLQEEWEILADGCNNHETVDWLSSNLIRPFLFFTSHSLASHRKLNFADVKCFSMCFRILLQNINITDAEKSFCSLAVGTAEERSTWFCQAKKLSLLCFSLLAKCDFTCDDDDQMISVIVLAMRLVVSLTDLKQWKSLKLENIGEADISVKRLIYFMGRSSFMYSSIRKFLMKLKICNAFEEFKSITPAENIFLITASALTLALRPFQSKSEKSNGDAFDLKASFQQYSIFILTVPYLTRRLPNLLVPAVKHLSVICPCLNALLAQLEVYELINYGRWWQVSKDIVFDEMSKFEHSEILQFTGELVPSCGWALANIIDLVTERSSDSVDSGHFIQGLDCTLYVQVINSISENLLDCLGNVGILTGKEHGYAEMDDPSAQDNSSVKCNGRKLAYADLLSPVHQQWHLRKLLSLLEKSKLIQQKDSCVSNQGTKGIGNLRLIDIVYFYNFLLRIFSSLNPIGGSLPILNVLSFSPGFITQLWETLEDSIFHGNGCTLLEDTLNDANFGGCNSTGGDKKQKLGAKDTGSKLLTLFQKIAGKSTDLNINLVDDTSQTSQASQDGPNSWDIEGMKRGSHGISNDVSCILHLFCAIYAHLLLILDDIEFYEKQVPFTLQQQQKIASVLNTFVYNSLIHNTVQNRKPVVDAAVKCLHFLYERDCRHKFCPSSLWVAPTGRGRIPIAAAARAHEAARSNLQLGDASNIPSMSSVLTTVPHVFPFEERVQMFRELVKMDKVVRRAAGEVSASGLSSVEIVVRRDHIVEDGFRQLNSLGPRLKSGISVSFISECGLPEAGLDYGGLSKEFLTDLSKAAFDPLFGLFSQTSTADGNLVPNISSKLLDNGMEMIEFLGRVVGKALYDGILLDYSFSLVFVQKLLGQYSFLDELSTLDSELYRNLMYLKHYDGDVEDLSLDFTVTEEVCGKRIVRELRPGGRNVAVTNENKLQYIHAIADYKLNWQMLPPANAFYSGLTDLIAPLWLRLFSANEFNQLLSGGNHDFDVDDLRSNTRYTGGYSEGSRTVKIFWEVVRGFMPSERCLLLKFVTSCSRSPLLGFQHLQPSFTIHKVAGDVPIWATIGGHDVDRLPSASTCYNTLKLPAYKRHSTLRSKLLYAITSNTGFELS